ncbi:DUF6506 family protein [Thermatribacter velox]|uniref:DUF6506 family protein n=1 Tax=Thermatribacter velox TaxID=3039681 RepID=A0ABZ2YDQ8_9BACT
MAFKTLFLSYAPDADPKKHLSFVDTGKYQLWSVVAKNLEEALRSARELYEKEAIDAITLCPGFTHREVAEIFEALGSKASVSVARGDGPSNQIAQAALQREYFGK